MELCDSSSHVVSVKTLGAFQKDLCRFVVGGWLVVMYWVELDLQLSQCSPLGRMHSLCHYITVMFTKVNGGHSEHRNTWIIVPRTSVVLCVSPVEETDSFTFIKLIPLLDAIHFTQKRINNNKEKLK